MLSSVDIWVGTAGTLVLWALSGMVSILLGLLLAAGSLSGHAPVRLLARGSVNVTRGVPTSLLVLVAGIGMLRLVPIPALPPVFPGTPAAFQHIAWGIMLALALGSAGHLAEIFLAARAALGRCRLEQAAVLGLSPWHQVVLLTREAAAMALPPTSARLVHHLHNTAFAALFPVTDIFGVIQGQSNGTFRVFHWALLGCAMYVTLSGLIWGVGRLAEAAVVSPAVQPRGRRVSVWS